MDQTGFPKPLQEAVTVTTAGATGVARLVIQGLLEIVDDQATVRRATDFLNARLTGYAPIWHITRAAHGAEPAAALRRIRDELEQAVDNSVKAAVDWVAARGGGPVAVAPSSSIITRVLAELGPPPAGEPVIALAGADAIGPDAVLNIKGTRELAGRLPTLVVSTGLKLVPGPVFGRLGAPVFEPIPLTQFAAVVIDGEVFSPTAVGHKAATLRE
nr:hypothetical protein [Micromonospora sp. DSM 115978]